METLNHYLPYISNSSLQSRQNQWQRESEERIRNMPDPDMPPGHRKMAEEERLKTLEILKESK